MKKIKINLLALGLLTTIITTSTPVLAATNTTRNTTNIKATSTLPNPTGTITSNDVYLRTSPWIDTWNAYNVLLKKGNTVRILGEFGPNDGYNWYKVTVTSGTLKGKTGYVASSYVDVAI